MIGMKPLFTITDLSASVCVCDNDRDNLLICHVGAYVHMSFIEFSVNACTYKCRQLRSLESPPLSLESPPLPLESPPLPLESPPLSLESLPQPLESHPQPPGVFLPENLPRIHCWEVPNLTYVASYQCPIN